MVFEFGLDYSARDNVVFGVLTHGLSLEVLLIRNKANPDTKPQAKFTALYFAVILDRSIRRSIE